MVNRQTIGTWLAQGIALSWAMAGCTIDGDPDASMSDTGEATGGDAPSDGGPEVTTGQGTGSTSGGASDGDSVSESGDETPDPGDSTGDLPPDDMVAAVVSVAHGGQTAMSCDRGRTWHGFHDFGPQDDHSEYAAFAGVTYGNGAFVAATGWGAPGHILRSADGLTWDDRPDDAFTNELGETERPNSAAGIEFNGESFVMFSAGLWWSDDGLQWHKDTPPSFALGGFMRAVEYLPVPDLMLVALQNDEGEALYGVGVSADGGQTWTQGTGITEGCFGYVQHVGGFVHHDGRLMLAGGTGPTCVSDDGGLTWSPGADAEVFIADLKGSDAGFVVLAEDGSLRQSTDGMAWTTVAQTGLDAGRIAWQASTGYVGADVGYRYAEDIGSWVPARAATPEGFGGIREFAFGTVPPTRVCPLR